MCLLKDNLHVRRLWAIKKKGESHGLLESVYSRRSDLRSGADSDGQYKADAMVLLVVTGSILGALGIYQPFAEWAGAGATVPLLGFGNTLWKGVWKSMGEDGFLGIFKGGFTASAVGISGALIFGYLGSILFKPKMKS